MVSRLAALLALPALAWAVCGDVNGDGLVNIGDALKIAQCDVGIGSCDFPAATACGPPSTTTTTLPLDFYARVDPATEGCPVGATCVLLQWAEVCDANQGPCPPEPTVAVDRSLDGVTGWTTILPASSPGQHTYLDSVAPETIYYYHVRVVE